MKVVGGAGQVADLHIVFAAELEETLEPRRGMFRPLPLPAMRQEKHEARHAQPLRFAGADELVDNDLGAVGEIAELRLPQDQGAWLGEAVAIFETEHGRLGKRAVDDLEHRLIGPYIVERDVLVLALLVDQHGVALRERAAAAILPAQADEGSLGA